MSIEIALTLHARDLRSDAPASVASIVPVVGHWARSANPDALIESGEWTDVGPTKDRLTSEKLDLGADADWAWVFRRYHLDDADPTVTWIVEIEVVEEAGDGDTEVAIILMRESSDGRVRPLETDSPEPPKVIRDLIDARELECVDGELPLWSEARTLLKEHASEFAETLMSAERGLPVIGVSVNPDTDAPIVDLKRLARRVAGMAHVWLVPPATTWALSEELPPKLGVFNGAVRIWWPGFGSDADPYAHHLFMKGKPHVEEQVVRLVHRASTDRFKRPAGIERAREALRRREEGQLLADLEEMARSGAVLPDLASEVQESVKALTRERDEALKLAIEEEQRRKQAEAAIDGLRVQIAALTASASPGQIDEDASVDPETAFIDEISSAYRRKVCTSDADRRAYPLGAISLHPSFLASVSRLQGIAWEKIVEVCAQVACGRAHDIPSRAVHRLRSGESGGAPFKTRRRDGAQAWRCSLQTKTASARRLHWWFVSGGGADTGLIEFAHAGTHDDFTCPE